MEEKGNHQGSNASAAGVYKLPGEPAIVINGVPNIIPSYSTIPLRNASSTVEETRTAMGLGEWLKEGKFESGLWEGITQVQ